MGRIDLTNIDLLDEFDINLLKQVRQTPEKIICCSPFRNDYSPSFFINLDGEYKGFWKDSGTNEKGDFITFLARLNNKSDDEVLEYLQGKYKYCSSQTSKLKLKFSHIVEFVDDSFLYDLPYSTYLTDVRRISPEVVKQCNIRESEDYIYIPSYNTLNKCIFIKMRSKKGKQFKSISSNSFNTNSFLYNFNNVTVGDDVYITEAEIDCLTLLSNGFPSVALMKGDISSQQLSQLLSSSPSNIYIAVDNDKQGEVIKNKLISLIPTLIPIYTIDLKEYKDVNEAFTKTGKCFFNFHQHTKAIF